MDDYQSFLSALEDVLTSSTVEEDQAERFTSSWQRSPFLRKTIRYCDREESAACSETHLDLRTAAGSQPVLDAESTAPGDESGLDSWITCDEGGDSESWAFSLDNTSLETIDPSVVEKRERSRVLSLPQRDPCSYSSALSADVSNSDRQTLCLFSEEDSFVSLDVDPSRSLDSFSAEVAVNERTIVYVDANDQASPLDPKSGEDRHISRCCCGEEGDSMVSVASSVVTLAPDDLRRCLKTAGVDVGPINTFTDRVYRRHLTKVRRQGKQIAPPAVESRRSSAVAEVFDWSRSKLAALAPLETDFFRQLNATIPYDGSGDGGRSATRRGCFNYLLLDPRLSCHVPEQEADGRALAAFAAAVFYVGKGQQQRSYCHLQEAMTDSAGGSEKVRRIKQIWQSGVGVVPVHVFLHRSAEEALVRESLLIETLELQLLTNVQRGKRVPFSGAVRWSSGQRKRLGVFLLYKALCQYQLDGETQLRPADVPTKRR